jgi:hypothetical protein
VTPGPHAVVKRELLVRYLDAWVPAALHGSRRATYLDGYASGDSVEAALGVIGEFTDLLARHALSVVLAAADGPGLAELTTEVAAVRQRVPIPAGVTVQLVPRPPDGRPPVLSAPAGAPMLAFLDATTAPSEQPPDAGAVGRLLAGGRAEALLVIDPAALADAPSPQRVESHRDALRGAGEGLVTCVELVSGDGYAELIFFATPSLQRLEIFKDALWAVDEYAGVRYRDPRDPGHALLDISLTPHPGPLRRALLGHLDDTGERTVAELRRFALTDTVYRAADVPRALTAMLASGAVRRSPTKGRLTAEAVISVAA